MRFWRRFSSLLQTIIKRMLAQPWLTLATFVGLVISIALTVSIPMYADAVYYRTFEQNIFAEEENSSYPPFAFMFRYVGSWSGLLELEDIQAIDTYFDSGAFENAMGLPKELFVRYFRTDSYRLFPATENNFDASDPLMYTNFSYFSDFENHVQILEGSLPTNEPAPGDAVEVLIHHTLAEETGFQVGETYIMYIIDETSDGINVQRRLPVRIIGVWQAANPEDDYWFVPESSMDERLLVNEAAFTTQISAELPDEIYTAVWYFVLDGTGVHYTHVRTLNSHIRALEQEVSSRLPDTALAISPANALYQYQQEAQLLTIFLFAFSVPIIGMLLAFISLAAQIAMEGRRNEIAVLRSRGGTGSQMIALAVLESLLVGILALLISTPIAMLAAQLIGRARSFLDFSSDLPPLRATPTLLTWEIGVGAVLLAIIAQIWPTINASRHTIISYKRESARSLRKPFWQRAWLDVLLLIPVGYGLYLLQAQGSVAILDETISLNPIENPLLYLIPVLGILALTMLFLRVMPYIMSAVTWFMARTSNVSLLMAVRHLARTPGFYSMPLVLLILTISLSVFTSSLAQTLDNHLYDQHFYAVGADVNFYDSGGRQTGFSFGGSAAAADATTTTEEDTGPQWVFLPVSEYLDKPGVEAVTRVGRYTARKSDGPQGVYLGIDRLTFPQVAFWRRDFSAYDLGTLMNALALNSDGILVNREWMVNNALEIGDVIQVQFQVFGVIQRLDMKIVGTFELFPSWYPEADGPLFVGNLEYMFEMLGSEFPYSVWLKLEPGTDPVILEDGFTTTGLTARWSAPAETIIASQESPQRQGLFGLLTVGYGAAALLTVVGFLLYAMFSFRRRFIELGVLRAIGLSTKQMTRFLAWELLFLILMGGVMGTLFGVQMSNMFIPYLQVGSGEAANIPPYQVVIAWPPILRIYALFGVLLLVALVVLVVLLRRMKIFQAIKLGETV